MIRVKRKPSRTVLDNPRFANTVRTRVYTTLDRMRYADLDELMDLLEDVRKDTLRRKLQAMIVAGEVVRVFLTPTCRWVYVIHPRFQKEQRHG